MRHLYTYLTYITGLTIMHFTSSIWSRRLELNEFVHDPDKGIPEECTGVAAKYKDEHCCAIPPFYASEISSRCGVVGIFKFQLPDQKITALKRVGLTCESWTCILDQYHLLVKGLVDEKRLKMHLDRWGRLNPEFKVVMPHVRHICRSIMPSLFPMKACTYHVYHSCYRKFLKINCPDGTRVKSTNCDLQKEYYDRCWGYLMYS